MQQWSFYLLEIPFGHAQRLGEVIAEAIPWLSIERQTGRRWRRGPHPYRCVERLRWNASWFTPSQLHLEPHNLFTYSTKHNHMIPVSVSNHASRAQLLQPANQTIVGVNCTVKCSQGSLCIFACHESHKGSVGGPAALFVRSGPHDLHTGQGTILTKLFAEHLLIHLKNIHMRNVHSCCTQPFTVSALCYLWANAVNVEVSGGWHSQVII